MTKKILFIAIIALSVTCFSTYTMSNTGAKNQQEFISIKQVTSKQGIKAWLVEDHSVPVISIDFSFAGAMSFEPDDKMGLAYMMSIMMDEGAGDYDAQKFQKTLADNVISMSFSAGRDNFNGSIKTLTKNSGKAFELLELAVTEPHFSKDSLDRMKKGTINSIKANLGKPNWIASRIFNGVTFKGHIYERPGQGNFKTISNIKPEDIQQIFKNVFKQNTLKISVAGDINSEELSVQLDKVFGKLSKIDEQPLNNTNAYNNDIIGKTLLYKMDIPQSIVRFGQLGISSHDKDYPAAVVLNYILGGGGFSSRLMKSLREDNGLTYGIYTSLSHTDNADLIQGSFSTKNATVKQAINLVKTEWQNIAKNGATKQEVADAISFLTGSLPLALTSTKQISGLLNGLQKNKRDIEYLNNRNKHLHAVTVQDVMNVAKRLLKTDSLHFVIVGQPENITDAEIITELPKMSKGQK